MSQLYEAAKAAYSRHDWPRARELFRAARAEEEPTADDLYALSDAAWWAGDNNEFFEACEQAFDLYTHEGEPRRAAIAAMDIAAVCFLRGQNAAGSGWLSRARRLLDGLPESAEHGYFVYLVEVEGPLGGLTPSEPQAAESLAASARRVQEIGKRHGDPTLVAVGILGEGRALARLGRVAQGMSLLDEATIAVQSDKVNPVWAGNIYCQLVSAADELADYRRAREWTEAMTRWLDSFPTAVLFTGICRVHRSRVHQIGGDWEKAELEAVRVCEELEDLHKTAAAEAHYQVGEIRRLRGELDRSAEAYRRAHAFGRDPQPGMALLHLAQGRIAAAAASIRSGLLAETDPLARARLLAAQVEIALAGRDLEVARAASEELARIAATFASCGLEVAALHAHGAILLAEDRPGDALPVLRGACKNWSEIDAPYDCARVRVLLARAYRDLGDHDASGRELKVAATVFERLGAARDLRQVADLRRSGDLPGGLTPREVEVLCLVASGKSNRTIADKLFLSEKTVSRHLANIFEKLGVTSRTAAAAFAYEHGLSVPEKA